MRRYNTQMPMVVSRQFDEEIIVANFETGIYYSLTGSAADIWLGLSAGLPPEEISTTFAAKHGVADAAAQIDAFIDTMLTEKIVTPHEGVVDAQPWTPKLGIPFSSPALERFDDLRDLLFLDPVHDVSEAGWPTRPDNDD
jgi:hypothetical protein